MKKKGGESAAALKDFLEAKTDQYNRREFITNDPVSIPHRFTKKQDIEISGLLAATLAWGQRVTIIKKSIDLLHRMDDDPHRFILHHKAKDLKSLLNFKHRTFNDTDLLYFIAFLRKFYSKHDSLEELFVVEDLLPTVEHGLINFHRTFFSLKDFPFRTTKHVATPERKSACKRLNMYLRWMVRKDDRGVDFGIWKAISPHQLICPVDLHVERVATKLKLMKKGPLNWSKALELTGRLRELDPADPVKYDFALFGLGIEGEF